MKFNFFYNSQRAEVNLTKMSLFAIDTLKKIDLHVKYIYSISKGGKKNCTNRNYT